MQAGGREMAHVQDTISQSAMRHYLASNVLSRLSKEQQLTRRPLCLINLSPHMMMNKYARQRLKQLCRIGNLATRARCS
jgi:hypothetical protein